jgi:hypothetical protein
MNFEQFSQNVEGRHITVALCQKTGICRGVVFVHANEELLMAPFDKVLPDVSQ